jgi:hypothetical protein
MQAFGRLEWASFCRPPSTYHMSTNWLCEPWVSTREDENDISRPRARFSDNVCAQEVGYYARAYMMDLFSLVMFPVHSEYIQIMYLQFICNIDSPLNIVGLLRCLRIYIESCVMLRRMMQ